MAVPIKEQAIVNHDGFVKVVILKDGSIYGIDENFDMMELSRSYAGGCIREAMKHKLTEYHDAMEVANLHKKMGDIVSAHNMHKFAPEIKKEHEKIARLFKAFKSFKVENDTHYERLEAWREAQAQDMKIKQSVKKKGVAPKKMHQAEAVLLEIYKPKMFRKEM
jgi:hypothetical protein